MEIFLVGGAIRDELLGLQVAERDWVVVGGTPEELESQGYRQVGSSFPVFLHPESNDEYALARTERKQGHGYHGFSVDFHPGVSLQEDLLRRDLTINAIAQDQQGRLIDPYNGQKDLEQRVLRHVSEAFCEDPLRVLRVARFAARFADQGFTIHPSTLKLMQDMVGSGELEHLVPERVWSEFVKAFRSSQPGRFVEVLRECGALPRLLPEVDCLFGVPQPEKYHPEIDTGVHVIMTMNLAAAMESGPRVVFALLLHDLGKGLTPGDQLPSHFGHEKSGIPLVEEVCGRFRVPGNYRDLALAVCKLHLRCHRLLEARPTTVMKLIEDAGLMRQPDRLEEFLLACEADYRGRKGLENRPYPQAGRLRQAMAAAQGVRTADIPLDGLRGPQIGERIREARVAAISDVLDPAG